MLSFFLRKYEWKKFFGFSNDEINNFKNLINEVVPNENSSQFPDFIYLDRNVFMEHFSITSSREDRKGSKQLIESKKSIRKNWTKHIESIKKYNGLKNNEIFMMQYIDNQLQTAEMYDENSQVFDSYRINVDKKILNWICLI